MAKSSSKGSGHHRVREAIKRVRWGEAIVSGVVGYLAPSALVKTGLPAMAYSSIPAWASFVDKGFAAVEPEFGNTPANPFWNYGVGFLAKSAGALGLSKWGYDYVKHGRLSDGKLNVGMPFSIGMLLDDVKGPDGGSFSGDGGVTW